MIVLRGASDRLDFVRFTADGRGVVAVSESAGVQVWPDWSAGGKPTRVQTHHGAAAADDLPDGRLVIRRKYVDFGLTVLDFAEPSDDPDDPPGAPLVLQVTPDPPANVLRHPVLSPDHRFVVFRQHLQGGDHGSTERLCLRAFADPQASAWNVPVPHRDARPLAILRTGRVVTFERSGFVPVFVHRRWSDGQPVAEFRGARELDGVAVNADRSLLAGFDGRNALVYRTAGMGRPVQEFRSAGRKHFTGLAFHPSCHYLAATNNDATLTLFDVTSGGVVRTFDWDVGALRSVAFSTDGTLAVAGSDKGRVVVWDFDA